MTNSPIEQPQPKKSRKRKAWIAILIILLCILLAVVLVLGTYFWMYNRGRKALENTPDTISAPESLVDDISDDGKTVTYQGETYTFNEDVVNLLVLGVDKTDIQSNAQYGKNGQADSLFLAAVNLKTGITNIIPLSRETMVNIDMYSPEGSFIGSQKNQLCLAYAYGSTGDESCQNVIRSVSRILYGIQVDAYVAIDLSGVEALTDKIGGVTLTAPNDLPYPPSGNSSDIHSGQSVTLNGRQAHRYIQSRESDTEANNRRMARQKAFLSAFLDKTIRNLKSKFTLLGGYYNTAKPYIVSSLSLDEITYMASNYIGAPAQKIHYLSISGTTKRGEKYMEFTPDSTSVYETVLQAFYTKSESTVPANG